MPENCDLCGVIIQDVNGELIDAKCLKFKDGEETYHVVRCNECFEKDKTLCKYKKCEVYSRVVGYMRPVDQWNKGKRDEYNKRKEFKNPMEEEIKEVIVDPKEEPVEE